MPNVKVHTRICNRVKGIDEDICREGSIFQDKPAKHKPGCIHRKERHHKEDCKASKDDIYILTGGKQIAKDTYKGCITHIDDDNRIGKETNRCGCPTSPDKNRLSLKQRKKYILKHHKGIHSGSVDCEKIGKYVTKKTGNVEQGREAKDRCVLYRNIVKIYNKKSTP